MFPQIFLKIRTAEDFVPPPFGDGSQSASNLVPDHDQSG
jgi:hypothetical protein